MVSRGHSVRRRATTGGKTDEAGGLAKRGRWRTVAAMAATVLASAPQFRLFPGEDRAELEAAGVVQVISITNGLQLRATLDRFTHASSPARNCCATERRL